MSSSQDYIDLIRKEEFVFKGSYQKKLVIKKDLYSEVFYSVDISGIGNIYKIVVITDKDVGCKLKVTYLNEDDSPVTIITPYFSEFNYLSFLPSKSKIQSIQVTTDSTTDTIINVSIFSI
jgi:hypothetical protein